MTGNKILDSIILALSFLATLAAVLFFTYTNMVFEKSSPDDSAEFAKMQQEGTNQLIKSAFTIKKLTMNLKSRQTRLRFLEIDIHLVPFKTDYLTEMERFDAEIKDIIIATSGEMEPHEINSVSGKLLYSNRIKKRINERFKRPTVKDIFFSKFTVQ